MSDALIVRIGRALWGGSWKPQMARAMDLNDRTVRRFEIGEKDAPDSLLASFRPIIQAYALSVPEDICDELDRLLIELPEE